MQSNQTNMFMMPHGGHVAADNATLCSKEAGSWSKEGIMSLNMSTAAIQNTEPKKEAIVTKYPKFQADILMKWMIDHKHNPCPNATDIECLKAETGLNTSQIINWTTNVRKRNVKATCKGGKKPHHFIDFLFLAHDRDLKRKAGSNSNMVTLTKAKAAKKVSAKNHDKKKYLAPATMTASSVAYPTVMDATSVELPAIDSMYLQYPDDVYERFASEEWLGASLEDFDEVPGPSDDKVYEDSWLNVDMIADPMDLDDPVDVNLLEDFAELCQDCNEIDSHQNDAENQYLPLLDNIEPSSINVISLVESPPSNYLVSWDDWDQRVNDDSPQETPNSFECGRSFDPLQVFDSEEYDDLSQCSLSFESCVVSSSSDDEWAEEIDLPEDMRDMFQVE